MSQYDQTWRVFCKLYLFADWMREQWLNRRPSRSLLCMTLITNTEKDNSVHASLQSCTIWGDRELNIGVSLGHHEGQALSCGLEAVSVRRHWTVIYEIPSSLDHRSGLCFDTSLCWVMDDFFFFLAFKKRKSVLHRTIWHVLCKTINTKSYVLQEYFISAVLDFFFFRVFLLKVFLDIKSQPVGDSYVFLVHYVIMFWTTFLSTGIN